MPISEFYGLVNKKNESPHCKGANVSYMPNDEFVELVWEKGQVMMQGQSSNSRKTPVSSNFQFHTSKVQEKEGVLNLQASVEMGLDQDDDDMVPWLNYPLDDYCSDLLPEISDVTRNEPSTHNGFGFIDNKDGCNDSHSHNVSTHHDASLHIPNTSKDFSSETQFEGLLDGLDQIGHKQDPVLPCASSSLLNFSHFSRPAAMAKANLQSNGVVADLGPSSLDIMKKNEDRAALNSVDRGSPKDSRKVVLNPSASKPLDESLFVKINLAENDKSPNADLDASAPKGDADTEKSVEPIGASSSVCSGNNAGRASIDLMKNSKRKSSDTDDFECQSDDVEEESLDVKTAGTCRGGTGSKRSRAAQVHNLSERRRRDRINEKMRALQELIPNCNKVDKASMLDEAIEYLKTLQLQVQIMSMGSGFCMPPTMFATGMQHMHPTHLSHMGYGPYGMGMVDMNGGSRGHPHMISLPPAQGPRYPFPTSPVSGLNIFQGVPGSNLQVYTHPGQGMPMLFPQPPIVRISVNPAVTQNGTHIQFPNLRPLSNDPMQNRNPHTSHQFQVANEGPDQSTSVGKNDQVPKVQCGTVVSQLNSSSEPTGRD